MRELMQKKLTDDHVNNVKSTEKSNILFNEMVRLGQDNEKHQQTLSGLQA